MDMVGRAVMALHSQVKVGQEPTTDGSSLAWEERDGIASKRDAGTAGRRVGDTAGGWETWLAETETEPGAEPGAEVEVEAGAEAEAERRESGQGATIKRQACEVRVH